MKVGGGTIFKILIGSFYYSSQTYYAKYFSPDIQIFRHILVEVLKKTLFSFFP